jgi:hypothetical protein
VQRCRRDVLAFGAGERVLSLGARIAILNLQSVVEVAF